MLHTTPPWFVLLPTSQHLVMEFSFWLISFVPVCSFLANILLRGFRDFLISAKILNLYHLRSCLWQYPQLSLIIDLWNPHKTILWIYTLNGIRFDLVSSEAGDYLCFPCLPAFPLLTLQFHRSDRYITKLQSKPIWTVNCTTIKTSPPSCE